jgi:hypothetical protein
MLSAYCTIACSLARHPIPAALPGSLAEKLLTGRYAALHSFPAEGRLFSSSFLRN